MTSAQSRRTNQAVGEYLSRQDRSSHPQGRFGGGGRWYPAEQEHRGCCASIRSPSRAWPYSLMLHCRTAAHVAALYGVDVRELRRRARAAS